MQIDRIRYAAEFLYPTSSTIATGGCGSCSATATPSSRPVRAALEALAARRNGGRTIAVLGPMAELGPDSRRWHVLAGRQAGEFGIDVLVAIGPGTRGYLDGANGRLACLWFPDRERAIRPLRSLLHIGDVVLLKGSRTRRPRTARGGARRQNIS